jgi:hypothetical protein
MTEETARLSVRRKVLLVLLASTLGLLWSCASTDDIVYKLYPGPERPDTEIVTLRLGSASELIIDGMKVDRSDYGSVTLLPGPHEIRWSTWFGVSVLVDPSGFATRESEQVVVLKTGHTYILKADRTHGHGYRTYLWIEDTSSGEVIAGTKKP